MADNEPSTGMLGKGLYRHRDAVNIVRHYKHTCCADTDRDIFYAAIGYSNVKKLQAADAVVVL
jgi:hypothetical protein